MADIAYTPVTAILPEGIWPDGLIGGDDGSFLDNFACLIYEERADDTELHVFVRAKAMLEARIDLPLLDGTALVFGAGDSDETGLIDIEFKLAGQDNGPPIFELRISTTTLSLSVSRDLLTPVAVATVNGNLQVTPKDGKVGIALPFDLLIRFDGSVWSIDFEVPLDSPATSLDLPLCAVGGSGVLIEATGLELNLNGTGTRPDGAPAGWQGLYLGSAKVYIPDLFDGFFATTGFGLGNGGLWGRFKTDFNLNFDPNGTPKLTGDLVTPLFGMEAGLTRVEIKFMQNVPIAFELASKILLPFFEEPVDVTIGIDGSGGFTAALKAQNGLFELTKEDILTMKLESVAFQIAHGTSTVTLAGSLKLEVGDLDWPEVHVAALSIDSQGHVHVHGGWLSLPEQYRLDFHGFQFEVTKLGFGNTSDGGRWIGFSGGLKLVDGFSAGASVDGLRVSWYGDGHTVVTLSGVGVEFVVPDTLSFRGFVSYTEPTPGNHRFDGKIRLVLTTLNLEIDGKLVIGHDDVGGYTYFAIYLDVELPAGIPLWTTGLGLYGFAGLFALQLEPDKKTNEEWYGVGPNDGWYKKPEIGVSDLVKWHNVKDSLGLGAGVTIGTVADNGFTFNGKLLLAIVFPGPILFIEGKANILKERAKLSDDPLLRALAVLDGRAGTVTIGLDAHYAFADNGEVIDIGGGAEVFFSFNNPNAWHLYLGVRDPRERRIRAAIFAHLFESNSYFMLDPHQLAMGAWVGYDKRLSFGPVRITIEAWIEGNALLSFKPVHFHGDLWLHGRLGASVFGFGFDFGADAHVTAEVFKPFSILIDLSVHIGLPWPLADFDVLIPLHWGPETEPPPLPLPLKEIAVAHLKASTTWPLPRDGATPLLLPNYDSGGYRKSPPPDPTATENAPPPAKVPVVPLDARPQVTFGRMMHDDALVGSNPQPPTPATELIGDPAANQGAARVRFGLKSVHLQRWTGSVWETVAAREAGVASDADPNKVLFGSWAPVPALGASMQPGLPTGVGQTKLWLWSRNPFDYTRHTTGKWDDWFLSQYPNYPCIPIPPDEEICCGFDGLDTSVPATSPVTCRDHPEFRFGWDLPARPVVTEVGKNRILCFKAGDQAGVLIGREVKSARIFLDTPRPTSTEVKQRTACADFSRHIPGKQPNGLTQDGFTFEVFDANGARPGDLFFSPIGATANIVGLDTRRRCTIELPYGSEMVHLDMWIGAGPPTIMAYGASGTPLASVTASGRGLQGFDLNTSEPIVTVVVQADQSEVSLINICATLESSPGSGVLVYGQDHAGREFGPFPLTGGVAELPGNDLRRIIVRGRGPFCVRGYCVTVGLDKGEINNRHQMGDHLREELGRWSQAGFVLAPYTNYRLRIGTTIRVSDWKYESSTPFNNPERLQVEFAYFRTEGPPGLANLSVPVNAAKPQEFSSGLDNLSRYVAQTVPATVPSAEAGTGDKTLLPKPVYRAYDVGVKFNEDYVDLMYRSSGRDLGLYLFDNNDRPARDQQGRLLLPANRWGVAEQLELSETDERWVKVINASNCVSIDVDKIKRVRTLGSDGQVLDPNTTYVGRLVPLLLHEIFSSYAVGASAAGSNAVLSGPGGGWRVFDYGRSEGPSLWVVGETPPSGNIPATHWIEQRSNLWGGSAAAGDAQKQGTILLRAADPMLPAGHPDQPANWTDYRFTTVLRSDDDDGIGVAFRHNGADNCYLFSMDRERHCRRLVRVQGNNWTILAFDNFTYEMQSDYMLVVEAVGPRLRVMLGGEVIFDVIDAALPNGGIGLYCWANNPTRFSDIRVDDLRAKASIVYRFDFVTSLFTNFHHHLLSGTGLLWPSGFIDAAAAAAVAPSFGAGVDVSAPSGAASDAEVRAYTALAATAIGAAAVQKSTDVVETTRIDLPGSGTVAMLLRTGEPIDWKRTSIAGFSAAGLPFMADPVPATGLARIAGYTVAAGPPAAPAPADESVSILLQDTANLSGWKVEYRTLAGINAPAQPDGSILAEDSFDVPGTTAPIGQSLFQPTLHDLSAFDPPIDPTGSLVVPGLWSVVGGQVRQSAQAGPPAISIAAPGTHLIGGNAAWRDYALTVRLRTGIANGALGVLFRYGGENSYYRFSLGIGTGTSCYRRLVRRAGGVTTVLWQDNVATVLNRDYDLAIAVVANQITVTLDGVQLCDARDPTPLPAGRIGLYAWRCSKAAYSHLSVSGRDYRLGAWVIIDSGGLAAGSQWQVANGALTQTADLSGAMIATADPITFGSYALWNHDLDTSDYRARVWLEASGQPEALGVTFRWSDVANHYHLIFDSRDGIARLVRTIDNVGAVLWQSPIAIAPDTTRALEVEAVGTRLRGWLDGATLFDLFDHAHPDGSVALYAGLSGHSRFRQFSVAAARPAWTPYYVFGDETRLVAGRKIRIFGGRAQDVAAPAQTGEIRRYLGNLPGDALGVKFPGDCVDLRLVQPDGMIANAVRIGSPAQFTSRSMRALRNADGTGVILFIPDAAAPFGLSPLQDVYRLRWTYRRDIRATDPQSIVLSENGDSTPEVAEFDLPFG